MDRKRFIKSLGASSFILPLACTSEAVSAIDDSAEATNTGESGTTNNIEACELTNSETAGPFPTKDPDSLERVDITGDRTGIDLVINIGIGLKSSGSCSYLEGAIVDIWHCDKDGYYSEYGGTSMQTVNYSNVHFLRGRQITNADGMVSFQTIFPGWYQSRATHIHVHIYSSTGKSLLVTQIAFPEGDGSAVELVNASSDNGYTKGMNGYTYNENDNVFSDGVANELATVTGSIAQGFELNHTIIVEA